MIKPDLIMFNGNIITLDEENNFANAIASYEGKIVWIGNNTDVQSLVGENTTSIDLNGKTVIPGLIDSHAHIIAQGIIENLYIDLSEESGIKSISDILDNIRIKAADTPEGKWIIGYQEDDSKLLEKRHPTRWELDEATDKHPVMVETVGGHFRVVNSYCLELAGVDENTEDPIGGMFDRDTEGRLTGGVHEKAIQLLITDEESQISPDFAYNCVKNILNRSAALGLTCIYDCAINYLTDAKTQIAAAIDLKNSGELPIRIRLDITIELVNELEKLGIHRGLGDDWLRICGIKYFFDGAISGRTAALNEPYSNNPEFYGVMATNEEVANKELEDAYKKGFRISAHANGDKAIDLFLDIMEKLQKKYPRKDPRNRDIHCSVVNPEIIEKIKRLDILPSIFGPYAYYHGDKILPAFGIERAEYMFAAKSFLDKKIIVAAHSDHPCSPIAPLMGIHALVNRKTTSGQYFGKSQRISTLDALRLYTINAAYHSFDENKLGSLEVGKYMDLVVLDDNILNIDPEKIIDIEILMTVVDGNIVYKA